MYMLLVSALAAFAQDAVEIRLRFKAGEVVTLKIGMTTKRGTLESALSAKVAFAVKEVDNLGAKGELRASEISIESKDDGKAMLSLVYADGKLAKIEGPLAEAYKNAAVEFGRPVPALVTRHGIAQLDAGDGFGKYLYMAVFGGALCPPLPQGKVQPGAAWEETLIDQFELPGSELKLGMKLEKVDAGRATLRGSGELPGKRGGQAVVYKVAVESVFDLEAGLPASHRVTSSLWMEGQEKSVVTYHVAYSR